jgi:hypothetical protein
MLQQGPAGAPRQSRILLQTDASNMARNLGRARMRPVLIVTTLAVVRRRAPATTTSMRVPARCRWDPGSLGVAASRPGPGKRPLALPAPGRSCCRPSESADCGKPNRAWPGTEDHPAGERMQPGSLAPPEGAFQAVSSVHGHGNLAS